MGALTINFDCFWEYLLVQLIFNCNNINKRKGEFRPPPLKKTYHQLEGTTKICCRLSIRAREGLAAAITTFSCWHVLKDKECKQ